MNYLTTAQYSRQNAALARATRSGDAAKVEATVRRTVAMWDDGGYAWPDDWHRWQVALDDSRPWNAPRIDITRL